MSKPVWNNWQVGATAIPIPCTYGGNSHDGIKFSCHRCGTKLIESKDIWKFKRGAIWTNNFPATLVKESNGPLYNKFKKCEFFSVACRSCGQNIGALYPTKFEEQDDEDKDELRPFPCVKCVYVHKSKANKFHNSTVIQSVLEGLNGEDERLEVKRCLDELECSDLVNTFNYKLNTAEFDNFKKANSSK